MPNPAKTAHPLRARTGSSQSKRVLEALQPGAAPIDGRSLADILFFISQYAGQVNFHDYKKNDVDGEYVEISDWRSFFRNSTPFLLARVSKTDLERIEATFIELSTAVDDQPIAENLELLLSFVFRELISSVSDLFKAVDESEISFGTGLSLIIKSSLQEPLVQYIALFNASAQYLCTGKQNFNAFTAYPWQLSVLDTYGVNGCIKKANISKQGAIAEVNKLLKPVFYQMFSGLKQIAAAAPDYIQESLIPQDAALQKLHQPHLGLLFAFLELFKHFQGDLNQLGQKHLDFFFSKVLNIKAKEAVPDKAHIVFELANHLEQYALNGGTRLKDGKDANNQDIHFALDDQIVLDKAAVADVRTLYLNAEKITAEAVEKSFVEGLYIAPVANSADGKGKAFKEKDSKNWPTLGGKYSKCILPGQDDPEQHPKARIGFVMASPALLLQEGTREVIFTIECDPPIYKTGVACLKEYGDPLSTEFKWDKYYWLTENVVEALKRNEDFSQSTIDSLNQLLARQNPYPIGYQQSQLHELLYEEGCNTDQSQQNSEKDAMFKLLEEASETIKKCFVQKKEIAVKYNALKTISPVPPLFPMYEKLMQLFGDSDDDESFRFVDVGALFLSEDELTELKTQLRGGSVFNVSFSGKDKWIQPECILTTFICVNDKLTGFHIIAGLPPEAPAVTFYDKEALQEDFHLENLFPAVKIELRSDLFIPLAVDKGAPPVDNADPCTVYLDVIDSKCCLVQNEARDKISVSLYDIFREFKVKSTKIDVRVCGVRNLVVQNDENLQDVNSPILPFGVRPKVGQNYNTTVGSNFYIGSKEVFCKNWQSFKINTKWKDKPGDLEEHYKVYDYGTFENGDSKIFESSFKFHTSILEDGIWKYDQINNPPGSGNIPPDHLLHLFDTKILDNPCHRAYDNKAAFYGHQFLENYFSNKTYHPKSMKPDPLTRYGITSRKGFARLTLAGVSFQHELYAFILAKQMFDLAGLVNPVKIFIIIAKLKGIKDDTAPESLIKSITGRLGSILDACTDLESAVDFINLRLDNDQDNNITTIDAINDGILQLATEISNLIPLIDVNDPVAVASNLANILLYSNSILARINLITPYFKDATFPTSIKGITNRIRLLITFNENASLTTIDYANDGLNKLIKNLCKEIDDIKDMLTPHPDETIGLPLEPYTPAIKELSIDYTAIAEMDDIDFVHLYPYENTNKVEDITQTPCLLPTFRDEGALFIGLNKLQPGGSLHLLFQLAEATADTEQERADVRWHYLTGNHWLPLRKGFEVISDGTDGLTVSGIVQILVPDDISDRHNTILPEGLFWIKASAAENVRAVSETIGIHTQAALTTALLPQTADKKRLGKALPAGSIAKMEEADFSIKKVEQPYASFGGKTPEADGHLYTRVSEHLRHKGRGHMLFDYEHLVLEAFPQIYKVKCISHTMGLSAHTYVRDLEIAPGFVVIAVIPDLTKLIPGNMMEPRAPVSLLEQIADHLRQRISPFARLKVLNPRFETVDVNISFRLRRGKPKDYYAKQLKTDLLHFLAPWYLGDSEKVAFGQNLLFSDVVKFVESLDYVDFIAELELKGPCDQTGSIIRPLTARSILTGGTVCVTIDDEDCSKLPGNTPPGSVANPKAFDENSDWDCKTTETFFQKPVDVGSNDCITP